MEDSPKQEWGLSGGVPDLRSAQDMLHRMSTPDLLSLAGPGLTAHPLSLVEG